MSDVLNWDGWNSASDALRAEVERLRAGLGKND